MTPPPGQKVADALISHLYGEEKSSSADTAHALSTSLLPSRIRGLHYHTYRAGEWAEVLYASNWTVRGKSRLCYSIRFADGTLDWVPLSDVSVGRYEVEYYADAQPVADIAAFTD